MELSISECRSRLGIVSVRAPRFGSRRSRYTQPLKLEEAQPSRHGDSVVCFPGNQTCGLWALASYLSSQNAALPCYDLSGKHFGEEPPFLPCLHLECRSELVVTQSAEFRASRCLGNSPNRPQALGALGSSDEMKTLDGTNRPRCHRPGARSSRSSPHILFLECAKSPERLQV
ncbi:hypothetical protein CONPUDRAFT_137474 [Coniophora puteana RWD-64-598 SS2]|uniref:Uncharacterized protein n=1 Tax=Coniophora puteana (strain RWD-64-598) TaxID=741705 RepID=A0A5M3MRD7_CONPW|nr:uncharacterized protein CONPUDRAFT_137474 [Coniophora puteana RWD-64-598 SS2]EIW81646.1 hypothetical protein CONPUDRAFT_137474 [Coniophora puteana RWD-64-598 SS2]